MKLSKKLLYSAVVLATVAGPTVSPVAQFATGMSVVRAAEVSKERPATTTVNIFKLQADSYNQNIVDGDGIPNKDGEVVDYTKLGQGVKPLEGVVFKRYKVKEDSKLTNEQLKEFKTVKLADAKVASGQDLEEGVVLSKTGTDGRVVETLPSKTNVRYLYVEDVENSPSKISKAYAVPFVLELPVANSTGTGFLSEINIYPKNVVTDEPKTDKDVKKLGQDDAGYTIGEEFNWFLKSTIPTNLGDYEKFEITDKLAASLTYKSVGDIKIGSKILKSGVHYTVEAPTVDNQNTLKITFIPEKFKEIAELLKGMTLVKNQDALDKATANTDDAAFLEIPVASTINEKAVLGKAIENTFELQYDHTPDKADNPKPSNPPRKPEVHTGGKRFVKKDSTETQTLGGAEFDLLASDGTAVKWTDALIKANTNQNYIAGKAVTGQPIKLKSHTDGTFEIKGLAYAVDANAEGAAVAYKLKETKAPEGYVIPDKEIEFTVSQTSYNTKPTDITVDSADATPDTIKNNKRPSIPNTGGIGTAIFVAIGAAVMAFAAKGMKRRTKDN
ncbi:SpaH/EbpB family LPXTG-anchored major pilin [Streptococcus dysgalactiae]|uniref:SpaH/EbpB family LPXTG-anchored major pilin n=1 Tax=Streptococcus dysgalactiae TaxID=1334 RepID=UPI0013FE01F0|nr:SpaH/EbpB family LPXTG-anchored major pilin [Streptococcus dysgalactiae]